MDIVLGMINVKDCTGSFQRIFDLIKYEMCWDTMPAATWHTPSSSIQEGIHNDGCPCCIWCIRGHSCTGSHCQYQLIVACCNLFSCNGAVVLCVCWHVTIIVAIMVIVIVKWHWRLDAFNGITTLIIALGVTSGVCFCVTRTTQISGCTRLVPEVLRTFRHQLCVERDVTAAFLPHQG